MCDVTSAFSSCGSFYASLGKDGKIRIWNTSTDVLLREYIPDKHLSAPITCLRWITSKSGKRKSESDSSMSTSLLVMGTSSGHLVVYNLSLSKLVTNISHKGENKILCIAWNEQSKQDVYTFSDSKSVSLWSLSNNSVKSLWKINKGKPKCIELFQDCSHLITASNSISIWNIEKRFLVKSFIGHMGQITSVYSIIAPNDTYVISASKGDRMISVWSMKGQGKTSIANFKTDESVVSISLFANNAQSSLVAVDSCGALHYFAHHLNGHCIKPIDAKKSFQIFKDKSKKQRVTILSAQLCSDSHVLVSYGVGYMISFDKIDLRTVTSDNRNVVTIVREKKLNNLAQQQKEAQEDKVNFKTKEADTSEAVYSFGGTLTNGTATPTPVVNSLKRKPESNVRELVMEDRLKNLILEKPEQAGLSSLQSDGLTHLLMQGLNSKDKKILDSVLLNRKESVIENTVKKLPAQYLTPLIQEIVKNVQKSFIRHTSLKWLRYIVLSHASVLQSNPSLISVFLPMLTQIETRSSSIAPLVRLNGRLNLLFDQMNRQHEEHVVDDQRQTNPVEIQDQDSEDELSDDQIIGMQDGNTDDSDDVWEEMSDNDEEEAMSVDENEEDDDKDVEDNEAETEGDSEEEEEDSEEEEENEE